MTARQSDTELVRRALRQPLPPVPPAADPRLLWTTARRARRLVVDAKVSLILSAAQITGALALAAALAWLLPPASEWPLSWTSAAWLAVVPAAALAVKGVGGVFHRFRRSGARGL